MKTTLVFEQQAGHHIVASHAVCTCMLISWPSLPFMCVCEEGGGLASIEVCVVDRVHTEHATPPHPAAADSCPWCGTDTCPACTPTHRLTHASTHRAPPTSHPGHQSLASITLHATEAVDGVAVVPPLGACWRLCRVSGIVWHVVMNSLTGPLNIAYTWHSRCNQLSLCTSTYSHEHILQPLSLQNAALPVVKREC